MTLGLEALCDCKPVYKIRIGRFRRQQDLQFFHLAPNGRRFADAGPPENYDGVPDLVLLDQIPRLEVIQLKTYASKIIAAEEIHILICLAIAGALENSLDSLLRSRIFLD